MSPDHVWHFLEWLHYLALGLWIGGIVFVCFMAAPAAHGSMASKAVAGDIVSRILKRLNRMEIVCCLVLLGTTFSAFRFVSYRQAWLWGLILAVMMMGGASLFYAFRLGPQMELIKERTPTFDSLSPGHAQKKEFNRLHQFYVQLMSLNLVLGLAVLYGSVVVLK